MKTWPDGTPKSRGNAFDWRTTPASITQDPEFKASAAARKRKVTVMEKQKFTIYSKARASK